MKVHFYDSLTPELNVQWENLWKSSRFATTTNSPAWFLAADETYHYENKKIVALFNATTLVGIGAFVEEIIGGVSVWTVPAREFAGSYSVLVDYQKPSQIRMIFQAIMKHGPTIVSNYKPALLPSIRTKNVSFLEFDKNHYIDLGESTYLTHFAAKIRRLEKKIHKDGLQIAYIPVVTDTSHALQQAFAIESISSKQKNGKGVFDDKQNRDFYKKLVEKSKNLVSVSLVVCNQKNIAYSINFKEGNALQGSQKAHVDTFSHYSPGKLLIKCLLDYSISKEYAYFDLGRGDDEFKRSLSSRSEPLFLVIASRNAIMRNYILAYFKMRETTYKWLVSLRPVYQLYKWLQKGEAYGQYAPAKN